MKWIVSSIAVVLSLLTAQLATAQTCCGSGSQACLGDPGRCGHCGSHCGCKPMCKIVCDTKEVVKTVWEVKKEWFCAPLPGCPDCDHGCCAANGNCSEQGCGCDKSGCDPCAKQCSHKGDCVPPVCCEAKCRKILVKKEVKCKIPIYKCVPCYACQHCCDSGACVPAPAAGQPLPAPAPTPAAPPAPPKQAMDIAPMPPRF